MKAIIFVKMNIAVTVQKKNYFPSWLKCEKVKFFFGRKKVLSVKWEREKKMYCNTNHKNGFKILYNVVSSLFTVFLSDLY